MMLLHFLRWLRANTEIDLHVLIVSDGELTSSFAQVAPVTTMGAPADEHVLRSVVRRLGWAVEGLRPAPEEASAFERAVRLPVRNAIARSLRRRLAREGPFDLAYLNSTASAPALELIPREVPVITHVHELSYQLNLVGVDQLRTVIARTDTYVAAARCVRDTLIDSLPIDPNDIEVCHEFIDIPGPAPNADDLAALRRELGIAPDTLIVGAAGAISWIKGTDILVQVARRVMDKSEDPSNVVFLWMGSARLPWSLPELEQDLQGLGLTDRVRFIGARDDPHTVMSLFDVFVLPSRSDPYPLVCLEAAALGKPIVCFDAGGMTEFLRPDERLVAPYLDVDAMASRIVELLESPAEREQLGATLARRVRERHAVDVAAPILLDHIEAVLAAHRHEGL
jgi:glycosyltransferase involved in cell wall biosynthesis